MASNINPNNIDGAYPVAGQDNNSQGFRDNFTNIKTNFQYTEDEINDLQNKALLKSALIGQTLDNNMNDALIYAAQIKDFSASRVDVAPSGSPLTATINYASGHYQRFSTTDSTTLAFQNFPGSGLYGYVKVQITITDAAHAITIPASVSRGISGIQGISPGTAGLSNTISFDVAGVYELAFGTDDGGSTITIFDLNRALTNFAGSDLTLDDVTATGNVSAAGNITGGNLVTGGFVTATGNITGANINTSGLMRSTGQISATGNITGGNLLSSGLVQGTTVSGFLAPSQGTLSSAALLFTTGDRLSVAAAGAVEFDGTAFTAATAANQRGVLGLDHFRCASGDISLTNSATAQAVFGSTNESISLPGSSTYFLEALYIIGPGSSTNLNAVTMSTVFAVSSALSSLYYTADSTVGLAGSVNDTKRKLVTAPTASVVTDTAAGGSESYITVIIKGILRTSLATTITPQISFSGSPAASSLRTLIGSYVRLSVIGNSSVTSVGNWS